MSTHSTKRIRKEFFKGDRDFKTSGNRRLAKLILQMRPLDNSSSK